MKKNTIIILFSLTLLLVVPGITFSDIFAEKLIVSVGQEGESAQFSVIDKTTGLESQVLGDSNIVVTDGAIESFLLLDGIDFTQDGLIGSSNIDGAEVQFGFYQISFTVDLGESATVAKVISENFKDSFCFDISTAPDGTLYCLSEDVDSVQGLYTIDLDAGTISFIGNTGVPDVSVDGGLAISSNGTIYLGNQIGLYTLDPNTQTATQIVTWDEDGDELYDEPHVAEGDELEFDYPFCNIGAMDFDSLGDLYAVMYCDGESVLAKIGLNPPTVTTTSNPPEANLTLSLILRNDNLALSGEEMLSNPMTFSPFDFDFLLGTTYGTVTEGFDSFTANIEDGKNLIKSLDPAALTLCDNTALSMGAESEFIADGCDTTSISQVMGIVDVTFTPNNGNIFPLMTTIIDGDSVVFDPAQCTLSYESTNPENSIVIEQFDEEPVTLSPGEILECFKPIDHYLGYDAKIVRVDDDDEEDDKHGDNDNYSKFKEYLNYFKENHSDKYKQFKNYLKYFKDHKSEKSETYFKYAKYFYEKYHDEDDEPKSEKLTVNLVDGFISANYEVKKLKKLYNPVDIKSEGTEDQDINSPESHLVSYEIKKLKGEPKFEKIKNIQVSNQFGDTIIALKKDAKKLLVPSNKTHDEPATELNNIVINHFKCYDAKVYKYEPRWEHKRTVDLTDQFGSMTMELKKPKLLCSPVDKNSEGIENEENFLMCYDLKKIKGEPKFKKLNVFTNNQFGPEQLEVKKPKQLCVPSEVIRPE